MSHAEELWDHAAKEAKRLMAEQELMEAVKPMADKLAADPYGYVILLSNLYTKNKSLEKELAETKEKLISLHWELYPDRMGR